MPAVLCLMTFGRSFMVWLGLGFRRLYMVIGLAMGGI